MIENNQWYLHWDLRTICWMPLHNEQARFIGSSSNPLSRLLLYLKRKIIKYFEKDQKPNSLTILIFVPPVLMHQMIYRLFSFWVISTPQELEMIIVFLTESPYLDYTLFLFFCVSWRTYLYANSDPRSHNSNPNDYTSSLESALKLPFL